MICVIDFDGTFFKNDYFKEAFFKKIIENPFYIFTHFVIKQKSVLALKHDLLSKVTVLYPIDFLINPFVLNWINENEANYDKVVLVSASPDFFVKKILKEVSCFSEVHGSTITNLKGVAKLEYILNKWGNNFDYIGDSKVDTPIFNKARHAFKVTPKGLINGKH